MIQNHIMLERVLEHFTALCAIPHGSGNTDAISAHCVQLAENLGLRAERDRMNNVIIRKPATPGYESHPTVILQGHLDMVCEKDPDCKIDFLTAGLRLQRDANYLSAIGTTLGADNGIAVAYCLTLLESRDLPHPPLEIVLTTDEETGLYGAKGIDLSGLSGRLLLNMDSEDEGVFTVSCAGGATVCMQLPVKFDNHEGTALRVSISGGVGGHSGVDINKDRANTNCHLVRLLRQIAEATRMSLVYLDGGRMDNAIPRCSEAVIRVKDVDAVLPVVEAYSEALQHRYGLNEPELKAAVEAAGQQAPAMQAEVSVDVLAFLSALPDGIRSMSKEIEGLPQTSSNFGVLHTDEFGFHLTVSVRSSVAAEKTALVDEISTLAQKYGASVHVEGEYPAWEYRKDSPLRDTMLRVYEAHFGVPARVEAIHAGLECGILASKLPGLDAVSFGPNLLDVHTPRERMDLASCARTWDFLCALLAAL